MVFRFGQRAEVVAARRGDRRALDAVPHVGRRLVEGGDRHRGQHLAVLDHLELPVGSDRADLGDVQAPALEQRDEALLAARPRGQDHALLRLGEHDLHRAHPVLAARHAVDVQVDAEAGAVRHLPHAAGEPGSAHVLHAGHQVERDRLEARLQQQLLHERVADLHGGAVGLGGVGEVGRGEHGAAKAVTAGLRADVVELVADRADRALAQVLVPQEAEGHDVDQGVLLVARVGLDLPADRGHADRVAVVRDALDHAGEQVAAARVVELPEAQRVEHRYGSRAHGEDVAQDAADAGGRALDRLDGAGVVVALHLEGNGPAVTDVDHPGVLPGSLQHLGAAGRQAPEQRARVLVAAVLAPQRAEHGGLERVGLTAEALDHLVVLGLAEPERGGHMAQAVRRRGGGV